MILFFEISTFFQHVILPIYLQHFIFNRISIGVQGVRPWALCISLSIFNALMIIDLRKNEYLLKGIIKAGSPDRKLDDVAIPPFIFVSDFRITRFCFSKYQLSISSSAFLSFIVIFLPSTVIKPSFCILISSLERDGLAALRKSAISCLLMETDMDDLSLMLNSIILAIFCLKVPHDITSSLSLRLSDFCAIISSMFEIKVE